MTNWLTRFAGALEREYERRIRRASLLGEYGAPPAHAEDDEADDGVVIANVPRGSVVALPEAPQVAAPADLPTQAPDDGPPVAASGPAAVDLTAGAHAASPEQDDGAAEIANVSPGTPAAGAGQRAQDEDDDAAEIANVPPGTGR